MEYTNIIAAVPEGEHFDSSAVNGGVWVTEAHLQSIENTLQQASEAVTASVANNEQALQLNEQTQAALDAANNTIAQQNAAITELESRIEALSAAPAAPISQTAKENDEIDAGKPDFVSETTREANRLRAMRDRGKK